MDSCSLPFHHKDCDLNQLCATMHQYGYARSEGYSSLSPASSTADSCGESPPYIYGNVTATYTEPISQINDHTHVAEKKRKKDTAKLTSSQRQIANEREKLRMRNLSKALQNLRKFLPSSVAPIDKPLTKIETLQHTIQYILDLSAQLGLTEQVLHQRRLAAMQRINLFVGNFCPQDFSNCTDETLRLCLTGPDRDSVNPVAVPSEGRRLLVESGLLHRGAGCFGPCKEPYLLRKEVTSQYPVQNTPLCTPDSLYPFTGPQQMIQCNNYHNQAKIWRSEQTAAQMDKTFQ